MTSNVINPQRPTSEEVTFIGDALSSYSSHSTSHFLHSPFVCAVNGGKPIYRDPRADHVLDPVLVQKAMDGELSYREIRLLGRTIGVKTNFINITPISRKYLLALAGLSSMKPTIHRLILGRV